MMPSAEWSGYEQLVDITSPNNKTAEVINNVMLYTVVQCKHKLYADERK